MPDVTNKHRTKDSRYTQDALDFVESHKEKINDGFSNCTNSGKEIIDLMQSGETFEVFDGQEKICTILFLDKSNADSPITKNKGFWRFAFISPEKGKTADDLSISASKSITKFFEENQQGSWTRKNDSVAFKGIYFYQHDDEVGLAKHQFMKDVAEQLKKNAQLKVLEDVKKDRIAWEVSSSG